MLGSEEIIKNVSSFSKYCYSCNRCVNVCPLSHLDLFFPRNFIADLIFSTLEEVIAKNNIWNCLTCGQCSIYCPMTRENEGVRIPELILELRKISSKNNSELDKIAKCETHERNFN